MDPIMEEKLLLLARLLKQLDQTVTFQRETQGREDKEVRINYIETRDSIKGLLAEGDPIDSIQDPEVRTILRNVRDGNFYILDLEAKDLDNKIQEIENKYGPEVLVGFLKEKGINVTDKEITEYLEEMEFAFDTDIRSKIDTQEYLNRKSEIGTIITDRKLPPTFHSYYADVRDCYLYGQFYAVVGLCRVLLEIAFRDQFVKLGLARREGKPNVNDLGEYENIHNVIRKVGDVSRNRRLKSASLELYNISSNILHVRDPGKKLEYTEVLIHVRTVCEIIEKLY